MIMDRPSPDLIRATLAELHEAIATVDDVHRSEANLPDDAPPAIVAAIERAASTAVATEARIRSTLADLVEMYAGAPPCAVLVDGDLITLTDQADGMAVLRADQVVQL
jgi:hypothetical protein